jgi:transcriptional regulator with XRE-family HTH domain
MSTQKLSAEALGLAVRYMREHQKMTALELAKLAEMTPSSLSRTERGLRMLGLDEAYEIARILNVSVADLHAAAIRLTDEGAVAKAQEANKQIQDAHDFVRSVVEQTT